MYIFSFFPLEIVIFENINYNFIKFRETDIYFLISGVAREDIQKEIHVLAEMEHTNIIYLHQVYENGQNVILVLEL